jgi:hypothetical protein
MVQAMTLQFTQPLTEMSTRSRKINVSGGRARPVRKADNLAANCGRLSRQCGILNFSQPYSPLRPVAGIALMYVCFTLHHLNFT